METVRLLTDIAFDELHRACEQRLIAIAFGYVRDWDTARDIVNDSFMVLWEKRDSMEFTNIEAYLYQMVKNSCLRYRRNLSLERSVYEKILKQEQGLTERFTKTIESCNPNELLCDEILQICRAEIERMPSLARKIFEAHKFEGKSYREIAESMRVSVKKVDNELLGVSNKLRRALVDYLTVFALLSFQS